jgi:hypothetical protein
MAEMVAANFPANVAVLADLVKDLYQFALREDTDQNEGRPKALASVPEAKEIEALLQP